MYLVFDVGATFIKYALMTFEGEILEKGKTPTPVPPDKGIDDFISVLGEVYDSYKDKENIEGIAIDLPGQVDVDNGIVYGGGGLKYTHNAHLGELISNRCDNTRVALENDGHAAALAEVWKGNASDAVNACVLVFGTGIGGGIVIDRKIYRGRNLLAGEISFCYDGLKRNELYKVASIDRMRCLEDEYRELAFTWSTKNSTRALCFRVSVALGVPSSEIDGERIYELIDEGNETVIEIMEDYYFDIAKYCCNLYMTLNPDVILLGGGISAQPAFVEGVKKYVKELSKIGRIYDNLKIDVCRFRNDSNLLGSLYNFKEKYGLL